MTLYTIINAACQSTGVDMDELTSTSRAPAVVAARCSIAYHARRDNVNYHSFQEIATAIRGRKTSHSSVHCMIRRAAKALAGGTKDLDKRIRAAISQTEWRLPR